MRSANRFIIISLVSVLFLTVGLYFAMQSIAVNNKTTLREQSQLKVELDKNNNVIVPPPTNKALLNYNIKVVYWGIDTAWGVLVPLLFLFTGFSSRLRDWSTKIGHNYVFSIGIYFVIAYGILFLLDLPLIYFGGFFRSHILGLSSQPLSLWFGTRVKELAVNLLIGFIIVWVPYYLIKLSPRRWWLYTGLLSIPFFTITMLASPLYIDPIFNKFTPIQDKALESKIDNLTEHSGIGDASIFIVDKSKETNTMNAYMTGVFNTKRIVIWDTTLKGLNERELLSVVGHEIGHYVLGHIPQSIALGSIVTILLLYLANITCLSFIGRFGRNFGFNSLADFASMPLIILVINLYMLIAAPFMNAYSRHIELKADRFALELTKDSYGFATSEIKFQEINLSVPRPGFFYNLWNSDHPSEEERIRFSNTYKPWEHNEELKYKKYINNK